MKTTSHTRAYRLSTIWRHICSCYHTKYTNTVSKRCWCWIRSFLHAIKTSNSSCWIDIQLTDSRLQRLSHDSLQTPVENWATHSVDGLRNSWTSYRVRIFRGLGKFSPSRAGDLTRHHQGRMVSHVIVSILFIFSLLLCSQFPSSVMCLPMSGTSLYTPCIVFCHFMIWCWFDIHKGAAKIKRQFRENNERAER